MERKKKKVTSLADRKKQQEEQYIREQMEEVLSQLETKAEEMRLRVYWLVECFHGKTDRRKQSLGFLLGDIRRVQERVEKIRKILPANPNKENKG